MKDLIITDEIKNINIEQKGAKALQTGYFNKTKIAQTGKSYSNEKGLQKVFCQWIDENYPGLFYFSTLNGEWFGTSQAVQLMAMQSKAYKIIDFFLMKQKHSVLLNSGYCGLAIELKMDGEKLVKKDGSWATDHIAAQAKALEYLRNEGWRAVFAVGLTEAKQQFSYYMSL